MATIGMAWAEGRTKKPRVRRDPLALRLARWAGRTLPRWKKFRSTIMQTTGLGFIDFGFFHISLIAGLISVGVSLFLLEWLSGAE